MALGAQELRSDQSGGAPALRPGAVAQSPGREAALAWASLALRGAGKAGNPFQTTQGNRLSCRDQEGFCFAP